MIKNSREDGSPRLTKDHPATKPLAKRKKEDEAS